MSLRACRYRLFLLENFFSFNTSIMVNPLLACLPRRASLLSRDCWFPSSISRCARGATHTPFSSRASADQRPVLLGIDFRKFSPEEQNLSRVVHPDQDDHQRAGCAIRGCEVGLADVESNQQLSDFKKKCRQDCADPDISPRDGRVRQGFVDERE